MLAEISFSILRPCSLHLLSIASAVSMNTASTIQCSPRSRHLPEIRGHVRSRVVRAPLGRTGPAPRGQDKSRLARVLIQVLRKPQSGTRTTAPDEIGALKEKMHKRVELVDQTLLRKQMVGGLQVDPFKWEDWSESKFVIRIISLEYKTYATAGRHGGFTKASLTIRHLAASSPLPCPA